MVVDATRSVNLESVYAGRLGSVHCAGFSDYVNLDGLPHNIASCSGIGNQKLIKS